MDVSLITMDKAEALGKVEAYRQQLRRRADAEYEAALAGYEALAEGTPLLNLTQVFAELEPDKNGRPPLAIARADRQQVRVSHLFDNSLRFSTLKRSSWGYQGSLLIDITARRDWDFNRGYALVPMVPADVRPKGNLKDYFILWEVEEGWASRPFNAQAPIDPFLLQHLAGDLYAVVAAWDLTPLEQAIMTGRRNS
jgi:hypothetical protein